MFWLGATVSLCYVPGVTGAYIATQWPVLAVLLSFGLLRKGPITAFHVAGLLFLTYAALRLPFSPTPYASVFGLWLIVIMALCVWFGTTLTSLRELYAGLALGASVSSAVAVFQYFGMPLGVQTATSVVNAPSGLYVNSIQQGTVLALIAVALVSERMWLWLLPLVPGLYLSHSRGAWIALAVGLAGCVASHFNVRRAWLLSATAAAVCAVGVYYFVTPLSVSDAQRMFIWQSAINSLSWAGWGPGVFYTIVLPQNGYFTLYPEYAHNDALQLAWEYGIAATIPIVVVGAAFWRTEAKEWPVVLSFVVAGCYSMPLFMPIVAFLALMAVGRILRGYGLASSYRDSCRQYFLSWQRGRFDVRKQTVPVSSHHSAKG